MFIWGIAFLFNTLFLSGISFADSFSQCPFRASDSSTLSLAAETKATITDLLDARNGCSQQFIDAVSSVQGIPELVKNVQNPDSLAKSKLEFINSEMQEVYLIQALTRLQFRTSIHRSKN